MVKAAIDGEHGTFAGLSPSGEIDRLSGLLVCYRR
jgi:hypothetical protein